MSVYKCFINFTVLSPGEERVMAPPFFQCLIRTYIYIVQRYLGCHLITRHHRINTGCYLSACVSVKMTPLTTGSQLQLGYTAGHSEVNKD